MATDNPMQLGMIGLGRMGANLVRRLMRDGHECVVYDVNADVVSSLASEGATGSDSLAEFVSAGRSTTVMCSKLSRVGSAFWSCNSTSIRPDLRPRPNHEPSPLAA